MTTGVAPAAFLLGSDDGERIWFPDSVLGGTVTGAEMHTRACGWPTTAGTLPPPDLSPRREQELVVAARRRGIDIVSP